MFLPDLGGGGAERVFLHLANVFLEAGHDVELVLARARGSLLSQVPNGLPLVDLRVPAGPLGALGLAVGATVGLARYLRRRRPQVLLSTLTGANLAAILARSLARSDTLVVVREACTLENVGGRVRRRLMSVLYPRADCVVALTDHMRRQLMTELRLRGEQIVCIPNPVDRNAIRHKAAEPVDDAWLDQQDTPLILGSGRLSRQKDFATLIRAFASIRTQRPARLAILGEGPERAALEALGEELCPGGDLHLPGFTGNPYAWMRRCALFVLSSRWEGHPNVVLEALSLQRPVVMTAYDQGAWDYAQLPGVRVVPAGDPKALGQAMLEHLRQPPDPHSIRLPAAVAFSDAGYRQLIEQLAS